MKTAVIILNYNGVKLMEEYLQSVTANTLDADIIVADNGSTDGSVEWLNEHYPTVKVLAFDKNYGFAEGYNKAVREIEAEYIVLLNSDVNTPEGWLQPLVETLDKNKDCVACQPKIIADKKRTHFEHAGAAGGFMDCYGYPFCRGRMIDKVEEDHGQYDTDMEIFWATGACMMIRREAYLSAGGLDARFFAHQEEIDLCWRLKARGHSIRYVSGSTVYHLGGGSLGYESPRKVYLNFRNNALMLYKNLPTSEYWHIAPLRFLLDYIAGFQMLLQGKKEHFNAVIKARKDFRKSKKEFMADRKKNLSLTVTKKINGRLNLWIIWQVYINKKRKFSELDTRKNTM
ncbi:MAG: glycosyltransferase family 2 protein [Paludibacteraceae bacterium]|nr:glycosyltransferase family 2 protein [Paludibacteraceae bacterium]